MNLFKRLVIFLKPAKWEYKTIARQPHRKKREKVQARWLGEWCDVPREMSTEESFNGPHEPNIDEVRDNELELVFRFSTFR